MQGFVALQKHGREQQQAALRHWRMAHTATALAAWRKGLDAQRTQHAQLQAVAARWSARSVAACWDSWRDSVAHSQELRSRLGLALGAPCADGMRVLVVVRQLGGACHSMQAAQT